MTKRRRAPKKAPRKPPSPSGMNEYCYKITGPIDGEKLKNYLERKIYRNPKFEDYFPPSENLPFVIVLSTKDNIICIKLTSRSKKNIERVESIQKKLTSKDLNLGGGVTLSKPELFELEQCNWWGGGCKFGETQKWKTLEHNGPYFTSLMEPYQPHKAPFIYGGKKYTLTPAEEKIANFYAARILSERKSGITVYWTKDPVFNKNFWEDFKTYLTPEHKKIFKDFGKADFEAIADKLEERKESETAAEKLAKKTSAAEKKHDYGYALINGVKEPVGNFTVEPAAIFLGRGENPKRGRIKREIAPEDVTINISQGAKVPTPPKGHKWGKVSHDQDVSWLASWTDTITGEPKYVMFAAEGQLKGKSDFVKYEKARKLNHFIKEVRREYQKDINSPDLVKRQLGTVIYLIDHFGLRAGGEKSKEETDTVGASTLRVEHIKLKPPDKVIFDFLGKDSVRYYKEMTVDKDVYKNIGEFMKGKNKGADLFNKISAADINAYLKTFDKSFTAKVFRTRLASVLMYNELKKIVVKKTDTEADKKLKFDRANVEVAEIMNHQRTVSVKNKEVIEKYEAELKDLKKELAQKKKEGKSTEALQKRVDAKARQIQSKSDTLNVAMNTSRANYIDPRIVVAWCLAKGLDISKVYTAPLQKKFRWAIETTDASWDYFTAPLPEGMDELEPIETMKTSGPAKYARSPRRKSVGIPSKPKTEARPRPVPKPVPKTEAPPKPTAKPTAVQPLEFHEFSARSFVVIGGSAPQKQKIRALGGIFNPNVMIRGKGVPGFIFPREKEEEVKKAMDYISPGARAKSPLIAFYLNQGPSYSGYTLGEILSWDQLRLEQKHDFIQTLFPLPTKSKFAPNAPVLTDEALQEFRENKKVRYNVYLAYMKMMNFFGYSVDITAPTISRAAPLDQKIKGVTVGLMSTHNYLRITRMLTFLMMSYFPLLAYLLLLGLCEDLRKVPEFRRSVLSMGSLKPWMSAIGVPKETLSTYNFPSGDEEEEEEEAGEEEEFPPIIESPLLKDKPAQEKIFTDFAIKYLPSRFSLAFVSYMLHIHPEDRIKFMKKIKDFEPAERVEFARDFFDDSELEDLMEEKYGTTEAGKKKQRDLYDFQTNPQSKILIYTGFLKKVAQIEAGKRNEIYQYFTGISDVGEKQRERPAQTRKKVWSNFFTYLRNLDREEKAHQFINKLFEADFNIYDFVRDNPGPKKYNPTFSEE